MTTIQDIFEMRKNGQLEEAYAAVLPMYRDHHGHYTTLCMFWTATDVMRLRVEAGRCREAEQILASLRHLYPNLQDKDLSAARSLNRLALLLATKEQEIERMRRLGGNGVNGVNGVNGDAALNGVNGVNGDAALNGVNGVNGDGAKLAWEVEPEVMSFSLLEYMESFGKNYMTEDDWQASEWNGHVVPSMGTKIVSRIFHEVTEPEWGRMQNAESNVQNVESKVLSGNEDTDRLEAAMEMVLMALEHAPKNKHLLRYKANLMYRLGDKDQAIAAYRQLIERSKDSYLYSELAGMVEDKKEQAALLSKAILNQRMEVFAQKDRLTLATLLKEMLPQNAAFEVQQVVQLRESLGQRLSRSIQDLQKELADITPATMADQRELYMRLMKAYSYAA